jgi:hypothetical protein
MCTTCSLRARAGLWHPRVVCLSWPGGRRLPSAAYEWTCRSSGAGHHGRAWWALSRLVSTVSRVGDGCCRSSFWGRSLKLAGRRRRRRRLTAGLCWASARAWRSCALRKVSRPLPSSPTPLENRPFPLSTSHPTQPDTSMSSAVRSQNLFELLGGQYPPTIQREGRSGRGRGRWSSGRPDSRAGF